MADNDTNIMDSTLEANPIASTGDLVLPSTPSYYTAADSHNVGNSQPSILDPTTWGDTVSNGGKFAIAFMTRAVASTWNIVPTVGNWLGGDYQQADVGDILRGFDDDLGKYYDQNKTSVDIVGDIAASFVPGMAGIKVLNYSQKAIALAADGRAGLGMARAFGTLPAKQAYYAAEAAKDIASNSASFNWLTTNTLKSLATGYGQNALEFAAFELAASSALKSSPIFHDEDIKDIFYNAAIGGGLIGGGVMTAITGAQTYGAIKAATLVASKTLRPFQAISGVAEGSSSSEKILQSITDLSNTPAVDATTDAAMQARQTQLLTQREMRLNNNIRDEVQNLTGNDSELGNVFADSLRGINKEQAFSNLMGLQEASRINKVGEYEKSILDLKAAQTKNPALAKEDIPGVQAKILRLRGEDAGTVFTDLPPAAFTLGDRMSADAVTKFVAAQKFKTGEPFDITTAPLDTIEARNIWTQKIPALADNTVIAQDDLPMLERAYELNTPVQIKYPNSTATQALEGEDLLTHITATKNDMAATLAEDNPKMTTTEISRRLNTTVGYIEGTRKTSLLDDLFAMQSESRDATQDAISKGLRTQEQGPIETWLQPKHSKLIYSPDLLKMPGGMELDGMTYLQGRNIVKQMSADAVFSSRAGDLADIFPAKYSADEVLGVNKLDRGNTFLASSNGNYGTAMSKSELIGRSTAQLEKRDADAIQTTFGGHSYQIKNSPQASLELATIRQQMLQTPERYIFDKEAGELVNKKLAEYEAAVAQGKKVNTPTYDDPSAPKRIPIATDEMKNFIPDWIEHNDTQLTDRMALRNQQGMTVQDLRGTFYIPPPDPKQFPHFAFVVDPTVTATGHVKMVWARSADELQQLTAKVPPEFRVVYKKDSEEYFKARREYDYSLGINENYMDAALSRSGAAANFFPKTDGTKIIDELLDWRTREDRFLTKETVYNKYSQAFDTFEKLGEQFSSAATSVAKGGRAAAEGVGSNPFTDQVKTALNVSKNSELPIWTPVNNLVEKAFSSLAQKVEGIWETAKTPAELDSINQAFKTAGINMVPQDATLNLLANHTAPKPVLSNFIRTTNSILSTLMLRADPLNAVNNGIGANVLLGAEAQAVIGAIKRGDANAVGGLADLAKVMVPGTADTVLSPAKLIAGSYANYFRKVIGDADNGASAAFWQKNGIITKTTDQMKEMFDNLALKGNETAANLASRTSKVMMLAKDLGNKAEKFTGNSFAEEMNRFVAADVMKQITDLGIAHGVIDADSQMSMINSFVNRTQGNNLASQRPMMFQGPVGQAIGLFQTYQFNMLQQIFRHVSEGSAKDAVVLLGLQGSIYGLNGLPAFNAANQFLVGGAAGNINHRDVISTTYDVTNKSIGDWLLYGAASNIGGLLNPNLKINLYSRGDINPRQVTIVPTNLSDVPVVGAAAKIFGSIKQVSDKLQTGASPWTTFLQGIEHAGISRPLAGLAQVGEAAVTPAGKSFSTTSKGDIVMQNDLMSLANLGRVLGGKPLDEAIARDAVFRLQAYQSQNNDEIQKLGSAVKTTLIAGGHPTQNQIDGFASDYVKAGGKQAQFSAFMHRSAINANASQANTLAQKLSSPFSSQMQKIMGGYELADFRNDPTLNGSQQ